MPQENIYFFVLTITLKNMVLLGIDVFQCPLLVQTTWLETHRALLLNKKCCYGLHQQSVHIFTDTHLCQKLFLLHWRYCWTKLCNLSISLIHGHYNQEHMRHCAMIRVAIKRLYFYIQKLGGFTQEMQWCAWLNWEKNSCLIFLIIINVVDRLGNNVWLSRLTYLTYIALRLNELCLPFQIKEAYIYRAQDNIISFSRRLQLSISEVRLNDFEFIPIFTEFRQESVIELCAEKTNDNKDDVTGISESPTMYFLTWA